MQAILILVLKDINECNFELFLLLHFLLLICFHIFVTRTPHVFAIQSFGNITLPVELKK